MYFNLPMGLKRWYFVAQNLVSPLEWCGRSLPLKKSKNFLKKMVYKAIVVLADPICRPYPRPTTQTWSQVILVLTEGAHLLQRHPSQHPPPHPSWRRRRAVAEHFSLGDSSLPTGSPMMSNKMWFMIIYPSQCQNLLPNLEIRTRNFSKFFIIF